jgi:hypothetical protein
LKGRAKSKTTGKGSAEWGLKLARIFKSGRVEGELKSAKLDTVLHPPGWVLVTVDGEGAKGWPGYILDTFVQQSIEEYLNVQAYLRRTLEKELVEDQSRWGMKEPVEGAEIWRLAEIVMVAFEAKNVPSAKGLANLKLMMPKMDLKVVRDRSDKPTTKTCFTVQVAVPWDQEHETRLATYRDGKFVSMGC